MQYGSLGFVQSALVLQVPLTSRLILPAARNGEAVVVVASATTRAVRMEVEYIVDVVVCPVRWVPERSLLRGDDVLS